MQNEDLNLLNREIIWEIKICFFDKIMNHDINICGDIPESREIDLSESEQAVCPETDRLTLCAVPLYESSFDAELTR